MDSDICLLCHGTGRNPWPKLPEDVIPEGSFGYRGYEIRPSKRYETDTEDLYDKYECRDPHYPQIFRCGFTIEEACAIIDERIAHPRAMA